MAITVDPRTLEARLKRDSLEASALDTCGRSLGLLAATIAVSLSSAPSWASVLPEGGQITLGQATMIRSGDQLIIEQKSRDLSATWQSFSIGQGNRVTFNQPSAEAVAVNRVLGSDVSAIQGALESNGKVFLINPNGILFSKTAQVNVGALVASTLELGESEALTRKYNLKGTSAASVINHGSIMTRGDGGTVALVAARVVNTGTIETPKGSTIMAAGSKVLLDLGGPTQIEVEEGALNAWVEQGGAIRADSGMVFLTAKLAGALTETVIKHTGTTEARTMAADEASGKIVLQGDENYGRLEVAGVVSAVAESGRGGEIKFSAAEVDVLAGARVDTSGVKGGKVQIEGDKIDLRVESSLFAQGTHGGGEVLVGGDWQGSGTMRQATRVLMEDGALIDASASYQGDGGKVVLWSNIYNRTGLTDVRGTIYANAGSVGGDGGKIETSGYQLKTDDAKGSARSLHGKPGEWLFDPYNVEIVASPAVEGAGSWSSASSPHTWTPSADTSKVLNTTIQDKLNAGTSVTITTAGAGTVKLGDITVNAPIVKTLGGDATLTLQAANNVVVNEPISSTTGKLHLNLYADNNSGTSDGVGVVILRNNLTTLGGNLNVGVDVGGVKSGGDFYVSHPIGTKISINTSLPSPQVGGGNVSVRGETIVANTNGLDILTGGGNVVFDGIVNSGNRYDFVAKTLANADWDDARTEARTGTGTAVGDTYLVNISSKLENSIAGQTANYVESWFGGYRPNLLAGAWTWADGPEAGITFFTQTTNGSGGTVTPGFYQNWNSGEPNGAFNLTSYENVGQFVGTQGRWNDLRENNSANIQGYVRETNLAPSALSINAGAGSVSLGAFGGAKELKSFSVTASSTTVNGGFLKTTETQTFSTGLIANAGTAALIMSGQSLTAGSAISLTGSTVAINLPVTATNNSIAINATGAVTDGASGYLVANSLALTGGAITLDSASNNVATLAATGLTSLSYKDANSFAVGTVGSIIGVATTSSGNVTLENVTGDIAIDSPLSATGGVVTLKTSGTVTDGTNGQIVGSSLALVGGAVTLDSVTNNVATLAASGVSSLSYKDADAIAVGTVGSTVGLTSTGNVSLSNVTGNISIDSPVVALSNTVTLAGSGTVSDGTSGYVQAGTLSLSGGTVTLDHANNDVGTLSASGVAGLTYKDANALTLGTINPASGNVNLEAAQNLTLSSAGGSLLMPNSNNVTFTGAKLLVSAATSIQSGKDLIYNGPIELSEKLTSTSVSGDIGFVSTVQSDSATPQASRALEVNLASGKRLVFNAEVGGGSKPLASILVNQNGSTYINANITTTGTQEYKNSVLIGTAGVSQFQNASFEDPLIAGAPTGQEIPGWTYSNTQVDLGETSIGGFTSPDDTTYPADTQPGTDKDGEGSTGFSFSTEISTSVAAVEDGTKSVKMRSSGSSPGFGIVRGPFIVSNGTVGLQPNDTVEFKWKAEGGSDAYDVFGYLLNTATGGTVQILNQTGASASATTSWAPASVTLPSDTPVGDYKFVFVMGTWDASGGTALGAQLFIDSVKTTSPPNPLFTGTPCTTCTVSADVLKMNGPTVKLGGDLVVNAQSASAISSAVSGASGLTKGGPGTLTITGASTYTGTSTINDGVLRFSNASAPATPSFLGTGKLEIDGFNSAFSTAPYTFASTLTGLTLGSSGSTQALNLNKTTQIDGPVNLYGGAMTFSQPLTASSNRLSLYASGSVTQTAAIQANELLLSGSGPFTLNSITNGVQTLAGGASDTPLGPVSFTNASALTVGAVGTTNGLVSSGNISISTQTGNLTISQPVIASGTAVTEVILEAGKGTTAPTSTGGNVLLSVTSPVQSGAEDRVRIYTGSVSGSTGVEAFVGTGSSNFRYGGGSGTNYTGSGLISNTGTYAIYRERPELTVQLTGDSVVWGSNKWSNPLSNTAVTYTLSGFVNGGSLSNAGLTGSGVMKIDNSTTPNSLGHGSYTVSFERGTLASEVGYSIPAGPINLANGFVVSQRPMTISANSVSAAYGEQPISLQYTVGSASDVAGLRSGDQITGSLSSTVTSTSNVGEYGITQGTVATPNANYALTFVPGKYTVSQRPVKVSARAALGVYGEAVPSVSYQVEGTVTGRGLLGGDQVTGDVVVAAGPGSAAGRYPILKGSVTVPNANYVLEYEPADLVIGERLVILQVDSLTKRYGDGDPGFTYSLSSSAAGSGIGLLPSDSIEVNLSRQQGESVGSYVIDGTVNASSNYFVLKSAGQLTINPRPVTLSVTTISKRYGEADPALSYVVNPIGVNGSFGLVGGDSLVFSRVAGEGAGSYAMDLLSAGNTNYSVTVDRAALTIDPRPITVTAASFSKMYGEADPALTYAVALTSGGTGPAILPGDSLAGSLSRTSGNTVGSYTIDPRGLTNPNYAITPVDGTLQITPRPVTVVADSKTKVYGDVDPALTHTIVADGQGTSRGLVAGDSLDVSVSRAAGTNAGNYAVSASVASNLNYSVTTTNGSFTIAPRPVSLAVTTQTKAYGDADPSLSYTINPDGVAGSRGVANNDTLIIARAAGTGAGSYAADISNPANSNYQISVDNPLLTITPRAITVTVDAKSKFYGDPDPALTYVVLPDTGEASRGLLQGDALTGGLTRAAGNAAGSYAISTAGLTNQNYAIASSGGLLTINPRPITVVADAKTKVFGEADPQLTYTVLSNGTGTSRGLVTGDQLSVSLSRAPGMNVGSYLISNGVAANPNYAITANNASLSITPRPVRVVADDATRTFGEENPALTYTTERTQQGIARGLLTEQEQVTGLLATVATPTTPSGIYNITQGSLTPPSSNYVLEYELGKLTVEPRVFAQANQAIQSVSTAVQAAVPVAGPGIGQLATSASVPIRTGAGQAPAAMQAPSSTPVAGGAGQAPATVEAPSSPSTSTTVAGGEGQQLAVQAQRTITGGAGQSLGTIEAPTSLVPVAQGGAAGAAAGGVAASGGSILVPASPAIAVAPATVGNLSVVAVDAGGGDVASAITAGGGAAAGLPRVFVSGGGISISAAPTPTSSTSDQ